MVRETLSDLRDIINNASRPELSVEEMLADLRAQTAEHLLAADISLTWTADVPATAVLPLPMLHALRSIIREAVQNVLKHSSATEVAVAIRVEAERLAVEICDNGSGFDTQRNGAGNGLENMRSRVQSQGGIVVFDSGTHGTRVKAEMSLTKRSRASHDRNPHP